MWNNALTTTAALLPILDAGQAGPGWAALGWLVGSKSERRQSRLKRRCVSWPGGGRAGWASWASLASLADGHDLTGLGIWAAWYRPEVYRTRACILHMMTWKRYLWKRTTTQARSLAPKLSLANMHAYYCRDTRTN